MSEKESECCVYKVTREVDDWNEKGKVKTLTYVGRKFTNTEELELLKQKDSNGNYPVRTFRPKNIPLENPMHFNERTNPPMFSPMKMLGKQVSKSESLQKQTELHKEFQNLSPELQREFFTRMSKGEKDETT